MAVVVRLGGILKILIGPIDVPGYFDLNSLSGINPGMGASEFQTILLAQKLTNFFEVTLWIKSGKIQESRLETIEDLPIQIEFDLQIAPTSAMKDSRLESVPLIAVSHHPFDPHVFGLPTRTRLISNSGRYQLLSNAVGAWTVGAPQVWLSYFFPRIELEQYPDIVRSSNKIGHISSLHPSKGFHDVLRTWKRYSRKSKLDSSFEVIGGISLYGEGESHPSLPVSKNYGYKLEKILQTKPGIKIEFLGRLQGGVHDSILPWDVAVLNPLGLGESENVSMKDCWAVGVPVVAGNKFGQRDYMRLFPELSPSLVKPIHKILLQMDNSPELKRELSLRARNAYLDLVDRGANAAESWVSLINELVSVGRIDPRNFGLSVGKVTARDNFHVLADLTLVLAVTGLGKLLRFVLAGTRLLRKGAMTRPKHDPHKTTRMQ